MRMKAPRLGDAFPEVTLAENQLEYAPLVVAPVTFDDGTRAVVHRWEFTPEERAAIARGEDLYITTFTFGHPFQPVSMDVGRPEWAQ